MKIADHTNFVSVISEEKPVMIFFHHKAEASHTSKIKLILKTVSKELPLLPLYDYLIDDNDENQFLAEIIGVTKTPILLFFKNGNFHRFKDRRFSKPSIMEFIGNKKPYKKPEKEKVAAAETAPTKEAIE